MDPPDIIKPARCAKLGTAAFPAVVGPCSERHQELGNEQRGEWTCAMAMDRVYLSGVDWYQGLKWEPTGTWDSFFGGDLFEGPKPESQDP